MTPKKNKMATILTTVKAGLVCKVFMLIRLAITLNPYLLLSLYMYIQQVYLRGGLL